MADVASVAASGDNQDDPLQDMPNDQIEEYIERIYRETEALKAETQMFENYLRKADPKALTALQTGVNLPAVVAPDSEGKVGRKRSKSHSSVTSTGRFLRLSADQKCDIALRELDMYKLELDKNRHESEKHLDHYRAILEEAETRLADIHKSSYEFERDVVKGGLNGQTKKIMAEKVVRYFEDNLRAKETLIEKLRLKNAALRMQQRKLNMQLKQKEEMGEILHEVDFQQLKIENQQYIEKIDEKNQELLRLKLMAGNVQQVLNSHKRRLQMLTLESERLKRDTTLRQDLALKIDAEANTANEYRARAELTNRKLRQQSGDYEVPEVMAYVHTQADVYKLKKQVRAWTRKVEIARMALDTHNQEWARMQKASNMHSAIAMK